jgi:hypothetical protein
MPRASSGTGRRSKSTSLEIAIECIDNIPVGKMANDRSTRDVTGMCYENFEIYPLLLTLDKAQEKLALTPVYFSSKWDKEQTYTDINAET